VFLTQNQENKESGGIKMKKGLALLLAIMLVASLAVGCAPKAVEPAATEAPATEAPAATEAPVEAKTITIGLVTDIGGIDDKSFNQSTWDGILKFASENNLPQANYKYVQSESDADYIPNLSTFADGENDIIVSPGFLFTDALAEVGAQFPDQKFLIIDSVVDLPNVASAVFAEHEGSYLAGLAAGLKAQEKGATKVGFLGGMDFDLIQKFEAGFEAGVAAIDPKIKVVVEYAGAFNDAQKGQTIAAKMYDAGAYVIYHAAGGTGNGVIKEAKDRVLNGQDVWVVGVDADQYADGIYEGEKSVILTSMLKRVDIAAYNVCQAVLNDEFAGGVQVFTLANGGVSLPAKNPNLKAEWMETINGFAEKVKSGEIIVPAIPVRIQ
jgi:basic membrane protein A